MKDKTICTRPGCNQPRWKGPKGNQRLVLCEDHQREDWRLRKNPNAKSRRPRGANHPEKAASKPVAAPSVPVPEPQSIPLGSPHVKVVLVDHKHDVVQRFDVPVLHDKKLSDIRNAARLLEFYRQTGHVVIEIGKKE